MAVKSRNLRPFMVIASWSPEHREKNYANGAQSRICRCINKVLLLFIIIIRYVSH